MCGANRRVRVRVVSWRSWDVAGRCGAAETGPRSRNNPNFSLARGACFLSSGPRVVDRRFPGRCAVAALRPGELVGLAAAAL